jgi:hypothetical protein
MAGRIWRRSAAAAGGAGWWAAWAQQQLEVMLVVRAPCSEVWQGGVSDDDWSRFSQLAVSVQGVEPELRSEGTYVASLHRSVCRSTDDKTYLLHLDRSWTIHNNTLALAEAHTHACQHSAIQQAQCEAARKQECTEFSAARRRPAPVQWPIMGETETGGARPAVGSEASS